MRWSISTGCYQRCHALRDVTGVSLSLGGQRPETEHGVVPDYDFAEDAVFTRDLQLLLVSLQFSRPKS